MTREISRASFGDLLRTISRRVGRENPWVSATVQSRVAAMRSCRFMPCLPKGR